MKVVQQMKESEYMNKKIHKRVNGSITVEAALLVPIVNILLIAILIISMMFHDKCVVRAVSEQVIAKNVGGKKSEEAIGQEIITAASNQVLASRIDKTKVNIGVTDITAEVYMENPWLNSVLGNSYEICIKVAGQKTKGVGVVRLFDVVINKINEIGW